MQMMKWLLASLCGVLCLGSSLRAAQDMALEIPLENTYWKLTHLNGKSVSLSSGEPFLMFSSKPRRMTGSGACNRLTGSYELKGNHLTFDHIVTTRMACSEGMDTENAFLAALARVESWKASSQQLELFDQTAKLLCRFEARSSPTGRRVPIRLLINELPGNVTPRDERLYALQLLKLNALAVLKRF
jgi:heat shock protein HslJ